MYLYILMACGKGALIRSKSYKNQIRSKLKVLYMCLDDLKQYNIYSLDTNIK